MMAIRKLFILIPVLLLLVGCEKLERPRYSNEFGRFIRFNLQVTNDGEIIEPGEVNPTATATDNYIQKTVRTLAIPVTITSEALTEEVEAYFSYDTSGTYSDFLVTPAGTLSFQGSQLTDTIFVDYLARWDGSVENKIIFSLDDVSDDSISLGNLHSIEANTSLTVELEELYLRYSFPVENKIEILGDVGETVDISVSFPDGFFPGEMDGLEMVIPGLQEFDYSLEQLPYDDDDTEIIYRFTLDEALDNDELSYLASFSLAELDDYILAGNATFSISKPENIPRNVSLNTAGHFYDLGDSFYRTYGETWMDFNNDGICAWQAYNAFTFPVVVPDNHPNAILADDMGTLDPEDDIYHHAFRIGFNSPNEGRTTNSFNLKRWFFDNYSDADFSPGFNIPQALEFFPDDGTSATGGVVRVITQDIIISNRVSRDPDVFHTHTISIDGEGEYIEISDGIFEITLEFRATNTDLFGGTRTVYYKIYNTNEYDDPVDRTDGCFSQMDL